MVLKARRLNIIISTASTCFSIYRSIHLWGGGEVRSYFPIFLLLLSLLYSFKDYSIWLQVVTVFTPRSDCGSLVSSHTWDGAAGLVYTEARSAVIAKVESSRCELGCLAYASKLSVGLASLKAWILDKGKPFSEHPA